MQPLIQLSEEDFHTALKGVIVMSLAAWIAFTIVCIIMMFAVLLAGNLPGGIASACVIVYELWFARVLFKHARKDWNSQDRN